MNPLDIRTILFSYVISSAICAAVITSLWLQNRRRWPELGFWLADFGLQFLAIGLIALRGILPDFVSVLLGTPLVLGGTWLLYIGLERYLGKPTAQGYNGVLLGGLILAHGYFALGQPNLTARNIILSLGLLCLCLQCAWLMLRRGAAPRRAGTRSVGIVFMVIVLVSLARLGADLAVPPGNDLFRSGLYDTLATLLYQMLYIALTFALFLMVNRRLTDDLEDNARQRQAAEAVLRRSENKLSIVFHNVPDAILITSEAGGTILEVNDSFLQVTGYSAVEVAGKTTLDLPLWDNPADRAGMVARLEDTPRALNFEAWFRKKGGDRFRALVASERIQLPDGVCLLSVLHDVTEQRRAEAALRESEERYRTVADYTYDWEYWLDPDGRVRYMSPSCERIAGYRVDEFIADPGVLTSIVVPEDRQAYEEHRAGVRASGQPDGLHEADFRIRRRDGAVRWIRHTCQTIRRADGTALGRRATNRDITDRKQAENALKESEERFSTAFFNSPVSQSIITQANSEIVMVNDACCRLFGYSREELIGAVTAKLNLWQHPADRQAAVEALQRTGHMPPQEVTIQVKSGETRTCILAVEPISWSGVPCFITTMYDITDRKLAEEGLRRAHRTQSVMTATNQALIHATDETELLTQVCHIIVSTGGYPRAWIGFAEHDEARAVRPVAMAPDGDGHWADAAVTWGDTDGGPGPAGIAIRTGRPARVQFLPTDPGPGSGSNQALGNGYRSALALPLLEEGRVFGAISIYSAEADAFPPEDEALLEELAGDLAFGIQTLRTRAERRRAEEGMHQALERLGRFVDANIVGVVIVSPAGSIIQTNDYYLRTIGYTREEFEKGLIDWRAITPPEWLPADEYAIKELRERGVCTPYEKEYIRRDGTRASVFLSDAMLPGPEEQIAAFVLDITERRQVQEALAQSEKWLRAIFEQAGVGVAQVETATGRFVRVNQHYCDLLGYTEAQMQLFSFRDITPPEDLEDDLRQTARLEAGEISSFTLEKRLRKADGSLLWVSLTVSPLWTSGEQAQYHIAIVQDIAARKRMEAEAQSNRNMLEAALANMSDAVFISNAEGLFTTFNDAFATFHRFGSRSECAKTLAEYPAFLDVYLASGELARPDQWAVPRALRGEVGTNVEFGLRRKDTGDEWVGSYSYAPIRDQAGTIIGSVVVGRDITDRKRAEELIRDQKERLASQNEELQSQNEELMAQERALLAAEAELRTVNADLERRVEERTQELSLANAALNRAARLKDEFLANMSHELRTPLTGILGLSETLQMGVYGPLTDRQNEILRAVYDSGQHLLDLINDILDLSKVEAGKMELQIERVLVADICLASVQFVRQAAQKKRLRLATNLDGHVTGIQADVRRLKQMLVNLLSNAVKFTPEGGEVGLTVEGDGVHRLARFTVWDTGIGIAPANMERLFRPFVQLDSSLTREYSGTGLGLSLVLQMAELHGGGVAAESEGVPGKGSRFTITLPWLELEPATPAPEPPLLFRKAVTVEDTPLAAEQLTCHLKELGITNAVHACGAGALDTVARMRPDVVLLDILLPDISGWEVLRQLKADRRTRDIPVVVVSVVDDRAQGLALGAEAYLVKPVAMTDLQSALTECMRRSGRPTVRSAVVVAPDQPLVLLADDNDTVVLTLSGFLSAHGFRLAIARTGTEALERAQEQPPDLVLMDIQMPVMDGLEAIQRIRAASDRQLAAAPIIALTALAMPGDRERCLAAGADEYLTKPVNLVHLVELIRGLLKTRGAQDCPPTAD